ncbi:MAG: integrase core domain-containing protein [bacterium]
MQQFNKFRQTKGFIKAWEYAVRFRDMITKEAQRRVKVLAFWEQYGDAATTDAFGVSRATLYRWQAKLKAKGGAVQALNKQSTAPKHRRQRIVPPGVAAFIIAERKWEKIGKEKLGKMIRDESIADISDSTVGRILVDLKMSGQLLDPVKVTLSARTGRMIERKPPKKRKKLRSKGHQGGLVKADTVVRFTNGIKRYVVTALDRESKFGFAYAYPSHSSKNAADFMATFKQVAPLQLTHVQTDNGSEFQHHFELLLKKEGITHFHSYPRCPQMQSEVERFNRTVSDAFIKQRRHLLAYNLEGFNRQLMKWLLWYNTRRPHWSLELKSPLRYICDQLTRRQSQMCWTSTRMAMSN